MINFIKDVTYMLDVSKFWMKMCQNLFDDLGLYLNL